MTILIWGVVESKIIAMPLVFAAALAAFACFIARAPTCADPLCSELNVNVYGPQSRPTRPPPIPILIKLHKSSGSGSGSGSGSASQYDIIYIYVDNDDADYYEPAHKYLMPIQCLSHNSTSPSPYRLDEGQEAYDQTGLTPGPTCQCDWPLCAHYGDCCLGRDDGERQSKSRRLADFDRLQCVNPSVNLEDSVRADKLDGDDYTELRNNRISPRGWWMLTACASDWERDENDATGKESIRQKCENSTTRSSSIDDILLTMPVSTENFTYSNVFCALCNFVRPTLDRLFYWPTSLACNFDPFDENGQKQELSPNVTVSNVTANCVIGYFLPPQNVSLRRCQLQAVTQCLSKEELSFKVNANISDSNYTCLNTRCREFAEYEDIGGHAVYKNRFCALCNGVDTRDQDQDHGFNLGNGPNRNCIGCTSFSSILNFSPDGEITLYDQEIVSVLKTCPVGEVYNPSVAACVPLVCPGDLELVGAKCQVPRYITLLLTLRTNASGELILPRNHSVSDRVTQSFLAFVQNLTLIYSIFNVSNNSVEIVIRAKASASLTNMKWTAILSKISQFNVTFVSNYILFSSNRIGVITANPTSPPIYCSAYVQLKSSQYKQITNNSIFDLLTGETLYSSQYQQGENNTILRCNTYEADFNATKIVKTADNQHSTSVILTVVSSAFSVVSCYLLFFTYLLFSKLRKFPGLCMMSYALALGTFYLFVIFGAGLVENEATCTAMGFIMHFFALSHLTWSTVLALNLVDSFVVKRMQNPSSSGLSLGKKFFLASAYAWGLPLLICTICLILINTTDLDLAYASSFICWLQSKGGKGGAVLYAIGIPGGIALVVNLCCYIGLAVVLSRDLKATQLVSQKSQKSKLKKKCRVFLGLFCLLGLTLIFGWIAALANEEWLWYVFFVANMTQAIVIFVVFVLSRKVRALYIEKFCPSRSKKLKLARSRTTTTLSSQVSKTTIRGESYKKERSSREKINQKNDSFPSESFLNKTYFDDIVITAEAVV